MRLTTLFCLLSFFAKAQTPYSHPVITVQSGNYITSFSQATNADTNIVRSSTVLSGQYYNKNGTALNHIVIINEGGPVMMTGGIAIDGATYTDIIGFGSNDAYGFQYLNGNTSGVPVHISGKAHHITLNGYKLVGGQNGGIWAKTENSEVQSKYGCDLSILTTPMTHINLSFNWIENCGGEAFYIGSTGWYGRDPLTCGGTTTYPEPQKVGYVKCDSNIIINPGRTGAQMSGSITNADNYGTFIGNQVYYPGRELNPQQGVGLSVGGGFLNPRLENNFVRCSYNYNYYVQGYGNVIFKNNIGDTAGYWKNVKNPQQIPGSVFSTSLAPTSWKITGNSEGYNSSSPSTGYAIYTSNKNADTGNIICNNTGNLVIFGTLIYSNNCGAVNQSPVVNAGPNGTRTLPANTYPLNGSASDADGTIASVLWTKTSGPATYTISNANILNPTLSNLLAGTYIFRLTATDNLGATGFDEMQLTVNPAPVNNPPVVFAGNDITIQLPTSQAQLNATATDDVAVASVAWTQIAGTTATISNAAILNPLITNLTTAGTRTFRIIATDNLGLKDTDDVNVNVLPAPNEPPVVSAGSDTNINLPATTVNLFGQAFDMDGTISSTLWTNTDGCSITSASSLITTATCTIPGPHVFTLVGTDDDGATTQDQMTATMIAAANTPPTITHRNDTTLYLPQDSLLMTIVASDADGTISNRFSYIIKTLYNARVIYDYSANPAVKNFSEGDTIIVVRRVTDDDSAYGFDTTTIYVLDTTNNAPNARINKDTATYIDPPAGQISIDGSGSFDNDNGDYISAYLWQQITGATATLTGTTTSMLNIDGMVPGVYGFKLTVTDSKGLTDYIDFTITVTAVLKYKISKPKTRTQ